MYLIMQLFRFIFQLFYKTFLSISQKDEIKLRKELKDLKEKQQNDIADDSSADEICRIKKKVEKLVCFCLTTFDVAVY